MFTAALTVRNFVWPDATLLDGRPKPKTLEVAIGRFAAGGTTRDQVWLVRDRLGLNKLFACAHEEQGILAANDLRELRDRGVPFDAIFAVPPATVASFDLAKRVIRYDRYTRSVPPHGPGSAFAVAATDLRAALVRALQLIRERVGPRVTVCLSGGLDSAVVAAHARNVFDEVRAFTYSFLDPNGDLSDDAQGALVIADHLGMDLTLATATAEDVLVLVDDALRLGQDWRDFNVHCAIVNLILARAIAADPDTAPTVLTGDVMNELMADYAAVSYRGRDYYQVPRLHPDRLRKAFLVGLQMGDREVGVFNAHGLDVLQPYAMCCNEALRVPANVLVAHGKRPLMQILAGDLLPDAALLREKVRAQIGDVTATRGILPVMLAEGRDARWLQWRFATLMDVNPEALGRFVRGGVARAPHRLKLSADGYLRG